ncbi:hypothetical protein [Virgibacillus ainsalahensis]
MFILNGIFLSRFLPSVIEEKHVYIVMAVIGMLISFSIIRPVIHWFVIMKFTKLLSYLIISLLILTGFFVVILMAGDRVQSHLHLLKGILQALAFFGIILIISISYGRLMKKVY